MSTNPDHSVAGGSAWLFWAQVVGNAGFFAAVLVLARALPPEGRGAVAFITVTALVAARVSRLGVNEATEVFVAQRLDYRRVLLTNLLVFSVAASVAGAGVVCGVLLAVGNSRPEAIGEAEVVIVGFGLLVTALADAGYSFLLGCGRFREQALVTATASWLYAALLVIAWAAADLTVIDAALIWTVGQAARAAALMFICVRGVGVGRPDGRLLLESMSFGLRAWIGTLSRFFSFRLDQVLMGFLTTQAALGAYAVAVNVSEVLLYLPQATTSAILPFLARSSAVERVGETLGAFRSLAVVTVSTAAVAALAGSLLIPPLFGEAYQPSVAPFLWLLPTALGYAVLGVFSTALLASGVPGLSSVGPVVSLAVGVGLDVILIPSLGATGAAIAASAGFLAGGVVALVAYRRHTRFAWHELVAFQRHDFDLLAALARPLTQRLREHARARPADRA